MRADAPLCLRGTRNLGECTSMGRLMYQQGSQTSEEHLRDDLEHIRRYSPLPARGQQIHQAFLQKWEHVPQLLIYAPFPLARYGRL
eukprot:superscaffoldBa00001249_g9734